jgi:hypothetical protein
MKRLQDPRMVDEDDRNDMEVMEHQGEDENHVLTTMENNPGMKAKIKNKKDVDGIMAIHEVLANTFLNLI